MSAAARTIHLAGADAMHWLRDCAETALDSWAREWIIRYADDPKHALGVHVRPVEDLHRSMMHEYSIMRSELGCMWFRCGAADLLTVSTAVVGAELMRHSKCADDWIAEVVDCAWQTRNRALCSALLGAPLPQAFPPDMTQLPERLFEVGSGAMSISCDELGLYAVVDADVWRGAPQVRRESRPSLPQLVPIERAIHKALANVEVVLGAAEVELPKLMDLRCGDVLRLSQRLDRGIAVLCEGQLLAHAALGQADGRVSVQITTPHQ